MSDWNWSQLGWRFMTIAVGLLIVQGYSQPTATTDAFTNTKMTEVKLKGLRVRLGEQIQVAAQLPWQEGQTERWAVNHPVPSMARFPGGELLVTYSLVADYNDNPRNISGTQFSKDGGKTWGERYDFVAEHQPMIYVPENDNSLMA